MEAVFDKKDFSARLSLQVDIVLAISGTHSHQILLCVNADNLLKMVVPIFIMQSSYQSHSTFGEILRYYGHWPKLKRISNTFSSTKYVIINFYLYNWQLL